MENPNNIDFGFQKEVVSERTDELAEEAFITESDINSERDRLVANFNQGNPVLNAVYGDAEGFKKAHEKALDTLIQNTVSQMVNVNDIALLDADMKELIKADLTAKLQKFEDTLKAETGHVMDVSDIEDVKSQMPDVFSYKEFMPQAGFGRIEGENNATVEMAMKGTLQDPKSLDISYQEPGGEQINMSIKTNEEFFASEEKTTKGSLADKVGRNRDAYLLVDVNYRIDDPKEFNDFLLKEMTARSLDINTLTEEQALKASVEIVKANLKTPSKEEYEEIMADTEHPSNTTSIDKLIMGKEAGVCRHFAAASRVVFEQMQSMANEGGNKNLEGTVVIENYMRHLTHGTLGIVRGNSITTMDPFWYAQGNSKTMDSTFDGKHGNVSSLFQTLCKTPFDRPEDKIFDLGNVSQMTGTLLETYGEEAMDKFDSREQAILTMASGVLENEKLQTPGEILVQAKNLNIVVRNVMRKDQNSEITQVYINGIKNVAKGLMSVAEEKLKVTPEDAMDEKLYMEESEVLKLSHSLLGLAYRRISGDDISTEVDETMDMKWDQAKETYNFEVQCYMYNDFSSKLSKAIHVGNQDATYSNFDIKDPEAFMTTYIKPAIESAKKLYELISAKGTRKILLDSLTKMKVDLEMASPNYKPFSKQTADAVMPIIEKTVTV